MHTGMHILCAVIEKEEKTQITGNNISENKSRLDVNLENFDKDKMIEYVKRANDIISKNLPVNRRISTRKEIVQNPELVKLAAGFPEHIQEVHLVEIPGIDIQPCGGTHVSNTSEIGTLVFLKAENRGKNNRRIYFTIQ